MASNSKKYLKRAEDYSYDIKQVTSADFEILSQLPEIEEMLGLSLDCLRWKYFEAPLNTLVFAAYDAFTKDLAGLQCAIALPSENDSWLIADSFVHPQHLKHGVPKKLIECCKLKTNGNELFGLPIQVTEKSFSKLDFEPTAELQFWVKPNLLCRLSEKSEFDAKSMRICKASKAVESGWKPEGITDDLVAKWLFNEPQVEYIKLGLRGVEDHILFRIKNTVMIITDIKFSNEENAKNLISVLNHQVVNKGFSKMIAYASTNSDEALQLQKMRFLHSTLPFGPYRSELPIMSINTSEKKDNDNNVTDRKPLDFILQPWNDYLISV